MSDREEFKVLMNNKIPVELLIEYIGAPENAIEPTDEARQTVFNRLSKELPVTDNIYRRICYGISYIAFALSFGMGGIRALTFNDPNDTANALVTSGLNLLPQAMRTLNVPGALAIQNNPYLSEISGVLFMGIGLTFALMDRHNRKNERTAPRQKISQSNNPLSDSVIGYETYQNQIDNVLNKLSEGDKHLLDHLSPFALRAVLISPSEVVEDILKYHKISFRQKQQYTAKEQTAIEFLGHMMVLPLPEISKNFIITCSEQIGFQVEREPVTPQAFAKRLEQYRSLATTPDRSSYSTKQSTL